MVHEPYLSWTGKCSSACVVLFKWKFKVFMWIKVIMQVITNAFAKRAEERGRSRRWKIYVSYRYLAAELHWGVCPLLTHPHVHIIHSLLSKAYAEWRDPGTAQSPMHHHYHHCPHYKKRKYVAVSPSFIDCIYSSFGDAAGSRGNIVLEH